MVQILPWLHSTFKDLSNDMSHVQIRVKTKKLWSLQVGEEKLVLSRKNVATKQKKNVATKPKNVAKKLKIVPEC